MTELADIFDADWNPTGEVLGRNDARRLGKFVKGARIWVINPSGEILFQLRAADQHPLPDYWDTSAGGGVKADETVEEAAVREVREEIGINITVEQLIPITKYNLTTYDFPRLHTVFIVLLDLPLSAFKFNPREIVELKYIPWRELAAMSEAKMEAARIIPQNEFPQLFDYLEKEGF
ncbi:MAG: NUDIX domain-containing protein [Alphaproteobacteria bacterium]|nr:NUDIX domain-containing protein [Alphaproteobacteria bacterium]